MTDERKENLIVENIDIQPYYYIKVNENLPMKNLPLLILPSNRRQFYYGKHTI